MRRNLLLTAMLAVFAVAAASAQRQVNEADGYRLLVAPDRADGSYGLPAWPASATDGP